MSEYSETFDREFLMRTQSIVANYTGEYEATLLLNCTLALICLPIEKLKDGNYEIIDQVYSKLEEIGIKVILKKDISKKNEKNNLKLRALRNGIAHFKIDTINGDDKLRAFIITGTTEHFKKEYEFYFTLEKLRKFCDEMLKVFLNYV